MEEEAALNKVFPCSMCHEEVEDHDAALVHDVCEQWEHIECIKVCDRPSLELYTLLSVTSSKAFVRVQHAGARVPSHVNWLRSR